MSDTLYNGTRFRVLNIIDEGFRQVDIVIDTYLPAARVMRTLELLKAGRGIPKMIRVDNGSEMTSRFVILCLLSQIKMPISNVSIAVIEQK